MPITTRVLEVGAEQATEMLSHNAHNRAIQYSAVMRLARDMVEGRWELSTDAIGFDTSGRLVNGQHRLTAILEAATQEEGITVPLLVAYGLAINSFTVIDQGRIRGAGQVLRTQEFPHYTTTSVVARHILYYDLFKGELWRGNEAISRAEVIDFCLAHRDELYASKPYSPGRNFPLNVSSFAALHYLVNRDSAHEDMWDEWEVGILKGENLGPTDPRLSLRNSQLMAKWGMNGAQPRLGAYIKAWNNYVNGRPQRMAIFRRNELPLPVVE